MAEEFFSMIFDIIAAIVSTLKTVVFSYGGFEVNVIEVFISFLVIVMFVGVFVRR